MKKIIFTLLTTCCSLAYSMEHSNDEIAELQKSMRLHFAALDHQVSYNSLEAFLNRHQISIADRNFENEDLLQLAAHYENKSLVNALHKKCIKSKTMHEAISDPSLLKTYLDTGVLNLHEKNINGDNIFAAAKKLFSKQFLSPNVIRYINDLERTQKIRHDCLHDAARDVEYCNQLIDKQIITFTSRDNLGNNLLHLAAQYNNAGVARFVTDNARKEDTEHLLHQLNNDSQTPMNIRDNKKNI